MTNPALITVTSHSSDRRRGMLSCGSIEAQCALGRGGPVVRKREGDGGTPVGEWPVRRVLYRPDRLKRPNTALPVEALDPKDGWCDWPEDPRYNRQVRLPYPARHEDLWRKDHLYDVIVVLGYNDDPPVAGMGSAIFFHLARPDYAPTEGCIAVSLRHMLRVLPLLGPGSAMRVVG